VWREERDSFRGSSKKISGWLLNDWFITPRTARIGREQPGGNYSFLGGRDGLRKEWQKGGSVLKGNLEVYSGKLVGGISRGPGVYLADGGGWGVERWLLWGPSGEGVDSIVMLGEETIMGGSRTCGGGNQIFFFLGWRLEMESKGSRIGSLGFFEERWGQGQ